MDKPRGKLVSEKTQAFENLFANRSSLRINGTTMSDIKAAVGSNEVDAVESSSEALGDITNVHNTSIPSISVTKTNPSVNDDLSAPIPPSFAYQPAVAPIGSSKRSTPPLPPSKPRSRSGSFNTAGRATNLSTLSSPPPSADTSITTTEDNNNNNNTSKRSFKPKKRLGGALAARVAAFEAFQAGTNEKKNNNNNNNNPSNNVLLNQSAQRSISPLPPSPPFTNNLSSTQHTPSNPLASENSLDLNDVLERDAHGLPLPEVPPPIEESNDHNTQHSTDRDQENGVAHKPMMSTSDLVHNNSLFASPIKQNLSFMTATSEGANNSFVSSSSSTTTKPLPDTSKNPFLKRDQATPEPAVTFVPYDSEYRAKKHTEVKTNYMNSTARTFKNTSNDPSAKYWVPKQYDPSKVVKIMIPRKRRAIKAAIVIQAHWRGYATRKHLLEEEAATMIQSNWRGHKAREQVTQMRAATSLQRQWRAIRTIRKWRASRERAARAIQSSFRAYQVRKQDSMLQDYDEDTIVSLQRRVRANAQAREFRAQREAAKIIQRNYRSHLESKKPTRVSIAIQTDDSFADLPDGLASPMSTASRVTATSYNGQHDGDNNHRSTQVGGRSSRKNKSSEPQTGTTANSSHKKGSANPPQRYFASVDSTLTFYAPGAYTVYVCQIEDVVEGRRWEVKKRYRLWRGLYEIIREKYSVECHSFPARRFMGSLKSGVVEDRRVKLDKFVKAICGERPDLLNQPEVAEFFEIFYH